jgi:hypothetical protein
LYLLNCIHAKTTHFYLEQIMCLTLQDLTQISAKNDSCEALYPAKIHENREFFFIYERTLVVVCCIFITYLTLAISKYVLFHVSN